MPSLRMLLVRIFPKIMGTTHNGSQQNTGISSRGLSRKREGSVNGTRSYGIHYTKSFDIRDSHNLATDPGNSSVELVSVDRESSGG
jgi:hypothetical protein